MHLARAHTHTHTRIQTHTLTHTGTSGGGDYRKGLEKRERFFTEDLKELTADA